MSGASPPSPPDPRAALASKGPLTRLITTIFAPPFRGLPIAVWLYFIGCFFIHPNSLIRQGNLPDGDDYMYLAQLSDWLHGQSWFDNVQHRLDPATSVPIDFSRLTELPMALIVKLLNPVLSAGGSGPTSMIVMAAIWPPVLFAGLLLGLRWMADLVLGTRHSRTTAFVALFATYLIYQFSPGHIDHHGLTALLVLWGTALVAHMLYRPDSLRLPVAGGLVFALAMAVGLEVLPPLIVVSCWLGLLAMVRGGGAARGALLYGLSLFAGCAAFAVMTLPVAKWFFPDQLGFSVVYVIFAGSLAVCYAAVAVAAKTTSAWPRYLAGVIAAAVMGAFFLHSFPALIAGPYGAMNPDLARFMFNNIPEAIAIVTSATSPIEIFLRLIWPSMGIVAAIILYRKAEDKDERWFWILALACLGSQVSLATFYQIRFMVFAQLFTIIPLATILVKSFGWLGTSEFASAGRVRFALELELLILIGPLPMVLFPAILNNSPLNTSVIMFPVQLTEYFCDAQSVSAELNRTEDELALGARPHLVMNDMAYGPELLYRTQHIMLAAPFHTDVEGNLDAKDFFGATDPNTAEKIIRGRNADLVVICRGTVPLYGNKSDLSVETLATRLDKGFVPDWLTPIHYPGEKDFMLFSVKPVSN